MRIKGRINMQIVYRHVSDLIPYVNNARKNDHAVDAVASSIKNYGFKQPIVIDSQGEVIAGHTRLKAAKKLNMEQVPCIIADDLTPAQIKAYRIADNRVGELAEWDMELLKVELEDINDFTGFELEDIFDDNLSDKEENFDVDNAMEEITEPITQKGYIYKLGNHRLMCGDSTNENDIKKLMNGKKADMVFTDPPYGVVYMGGHNIKKRDGIKNDELQGEELTDLFYLSLKNAINFTKDHSAFYIWYANGKAVETFNSFNKLSLKVRAVLCWYKVNSGLGAFMSQYIPNYEPCIYAYKTNCSPQWFGATNEKTVWELKKENINEFHPTQKPIELSEKAIKNSSKENDIILDLFGGSGATMIGCEKTKRNCFMMELDEKYCDVIVKRWEDFTGLKAERIE